MSNLKVVKFVNGEEVVGDLSTPEPGKITLTNPARFVMSQQGIGMIPFSPFCKDESFTMSEQHVLCIGEPEEEIYNAWSSQFGSGLVLAGVDVSKVAKTLKISPNS